MLYIVSVDSGSVSWAASIAGRRLLNGSMVVVAARVAKSHVVDLLYRSSQSGLLDGPSAGFFFLSKCWITKSYDEWVSAHLTGLKESTLDMCKYSRLLWSHSIRIF